MLCIPPFFIGNVSMCEHPVLPSIHADVPDVLFYTQMTAVPSAISLSLLSAATKSHTETLNINHRAI